MIELDVAMAVAFLAAMGVAVGTGVCWVIEWPSRNAARRNGARMIDACESAGGLTRGN